MRLGLHIVGKRARELFVSIDLLLHQGKRDPYVPVDGHMELRPDRPGWGIEIDEKALATEDYIHWERKITRKPDGSTAYP